MSIINEVTDSKAAKVLEQKLKGHEEEEILFTHYNPGDELRKKYTPVQDKIIICATLPKHILIHEKNAPKGTFIISSTHVDYQPTLEYQKKMLKQGNDIHGKIGTYNWALSTRVSTAHGKRTNLEMSTIILPKISLISSIDYFISQLNESTPYFDASDPNDQFRVQLLRCAERTYEQVPLHNFIIGLVIGQNNIKRYLAMQEYAIDNKL